MKRLFTISMLLLCINVWSQPTLIYKGTDKHIQDCVDATNKILRDSLFYNSIASIKKFDNSSLSGREVADVIKSSTATVEVVMKKFMPIATAKTTDKIKLSSRNFSPNLQDGINTLIHETVHSVDLQDGCYDFTHSSNDNSDGSQDNTAPWVIALIAEDLCINILSK